MNSKPIIAITMGDPAGVGPEIVVKALVRSEVWAVCRPLTVGDKDILSQAAALVSAPLPLRPVSSVTDARFDSRRPDILHVDSLDPAAFQRCTVSAPGGRAAATYIERAVTLVQAGKVDGIATAPINKAALQLAGIPYIGHTEMLAALTGADQVTTMLATPGLRTVHVTRHLALREVADHITSERVLETVRMTHQGLEAMGLIRPRLAVAALNPHSGDGGLLGREEIEEIAPAVESAQAEGIDVAGPIPADSVFFRAIRGEFDAVVAMYHDQGHIPIKTHDFRRSVTVSLGLPIVRTSVDHGTAFDIAWQGKAEEESLVEAIRLAAEMAVHGVESARLEPA